MSLSIILGTLSILTVIGFYMGRSRSLSSVGGDPLKLQSRPHYYGYFLAIWCGVPAVSIFGLWMTMEASIVATLLVESLPTDLRQLDDAQLGLLLNDIRNLAAGGIASREAGPELLQAAAHYNGLLHTSKLALLAVIGSLGVAGITVARRYISPQ